ncbi:helix-turn-helix transcriptional regulator [Fulvivirga sp. M361]|uniref:helix-turn-helix domain-containing protein n=1 Tax=Fulvivirga sp. M361 TaxID=2594266 RepID=UPI00117B0F8C|nr:helix-turn-helix transcriptional regulator [Fulvivirga sp. M361]TRX45757.1 helix-turn-helix transcriptional regulator [Fulvivirga sp. M361]
MNIELSKAFGTVVRERRTQLKLSQEELAHQAGLHRTYIGMIERGEKNIALENIHKISTALKTSISDLFIQLEKSQS